MVLYETNLFSGPFSEIGRVVGTAVVRLRMYEKPDFEFVLEHDLRRIVKGGVHTLQCIAKGAEGRTQKVHMKEVQVLLSLGTLEGLHQVRLRITKPPR